MTTLEIIRNRWSPRSFKETDIDEETINTLFESARWAPSSMNEQPWKYFYAKHGERAFDRFIECLNPGNQVWAGKSSLLILSVARKRFNYKNRANRHALHDVGAANLSIALEATGHGLQAHQMGGFDMSRTLETFGLDIMEDEPVCFIAVGQPGDPGNLPGEFEERERSARSRKKIEQFVEHFKIN